jgi:hypothetical protein
VQHTIHHFDDHQHSEFSLSVHSAEGNTEPPLTKYSLELSTLKQIEFEWNIHPILSKQISKLEGVMEVGGELVLSYKSQPRLEFGSIGIRYIFSLSLFRFSYLFLMTIHLVFINILNTLIRRLIVSLFF